MKRINLESVSHAATAAHKDVQRFKDVRQWTLDLSELNRPLDANEISNRATRQADAEYDQRKNRMGLLGATLVVLAFLFGMWGLQKAFEILSW